MVSKATFLKSLVTFCFRGFPNSLSRRVLEYGSTKNRTRTCTDGGKNPVFQEKFVFTLIEGLREIIVVVWNSNTLSNDDFIGTGKVQLQKVLSQGFDDSSWTIRSKSGRYAGEVRLIMHYANANKPAASHAPSVPPNLSAHVSQPHIYSVHPSPSAPGPLNTAYYPHTAAHPTMSGVTYHSAAAHYASPSPYPSYPQTSTAYSPSPYPLNPSSAYPTSAHPPASYPPSPYQPLPQPQSSHYPPPVSYHGLYPPPPY